MKIGSIYFAYATAADPVGDELDATSSSYGGLAATQNATQIFGPQKSRSTSSAPSGSCSTEHLLATAAPFETNVTNARETAPAGLARLHERSDCRRCSLSRAGLDFELAGKITDKWSVMGGLVLMDPR